MSTVSGSIQNFQLGDYQIDASNEVVGRVLEEMLMAPMNFGIQFDKSEGAAYVETFVSKELMAIGYDSKVKSHIYTSIHHTVYLDELSSQKLVNILLTKSKPAIRLVLFLSADSIQQVINSDGVAGTLTFYTSDFLLFN